MFFRTFKEARSLAPPFIFSVACARAGLPLLVIAPPSGGKSTVIFAVEEWLKKNKEETLRVSRLGLRGLQQLSVWLKVNSRATLLNEDYALIGSSGYMVEKMGELIGALSYTKSYQDWGVKLNITVDRLGFVSGVQPYWIYDMVTNPVFATHLREKFIRYYMLPFSITPDVDDKKAINLLVSNLKAKTRVAGYHIPISFMSGLKVQLGETRAKIYGEKVAQELSYLIPEEELETSMSFYAQRLGFETTIMERELDERGYTVGSKWHEYTVLYWLLRRGALSRTELATCLGVTSLRSVDMATNKAIALGWISSLWNHGTKYYMASLEWKRRLLV